MSQHTKYFSPHPVEVLLGSGKRQEVGKEERMRGWQWLTWEWRAAWRWEWRWEAPGDLEKVPLPQDTALLSVRTSP